MAAVKHCSHCQAHNPVAAIFCSRCGSRLDDSLPGTSGPTYDQVFEEPFQRLEHLRGTARLDAMLVLLDRLDAELSGLLEKTPERA